MELDFNEVQQMDSKDIYNYLLPTFTKIYESFKFIGISKQSYYELVLKEIIKSQKSYDGSIPYSNYITKKIRKTLSKQTKVLILDSNASFKLINDYINHKFDKTLTYNDAIKHFKKLDSFFETYDFIPTPDLFIELINKNKIFAEIIELVFEHFHLQIESGNIEKIFSNASLILAIEAYCMLNNIEIKVEEGENYSEAAIVSNDSLKSYFNEISKKPLLTIEQEKQLALKVAQGDTEAKSLFIESNLRLVVSVAKRYLNRGLSFLDLIQEGNLGLMKAVDRYDVEKGYKFSTYAIWWIRQAITRAIYNKGRNIRLPVYVHQNIIAYRKAIAKLEAKLGRQPTESEIANEMGISITEVTKICKLQTDTTSINALVKEDSENELESFISSSEDTPEDIVITDSLPEQLRILFRKCKLKNIEIEVLMLRNGFNNKEPMTLEQIAQIYNISRERVRQIEASAIKKIRCSKYIKDFAIYMQSPQKSLDNIDEFRDLYSKSKNRYKSYFKDDDQERENDNMPKRLQSIYEYFDQYSKEQVDLMVSKLNNEERALLTLRYGNDLANPVSGKLTKKGRDTFYGTLVPKMRRLLEIIKEYSGYADSSLVSEKQIDIASTEDNKTKPVANLNKDESCISTVEVVNKLDSKDSKKEKESGKMPKRLKSIYEYFNEFTKDEVDLMISKLNDEERALLTLRYGNDLANPVSGKLTKMESTMFYSILVPKMKRLLKIKKLYSNIDVSSLVSKKQKDIAATEAQKVEPTANLNKDIASVSTVEVVKDENVSKSAVKEEEIEPILNLNMENTVIIPSSSEANEKETCETIPKNVPQVKQVSPVIVEEKTNDITKNDCLKMLEMLRTPTFAQMMNVLTAKEAVIISLKLGYVDGKYFSTEAIAKFLEIGEEEVIETTKKILLLYKENINSFLDSMIEMATEKASQSRSRFLDIQTAKK